MGKVLKVGDSIVSKKGVTIKITKLISAKGGQGLVYGVDYGGTPRVLKWYKNTYLNGLRNKQIRCNANGEVKKMSEPDERGDTTISAAEIGRAHV